MIKRPNRIGLICPALLLVSGAVAQGQSVDSAPHPVLPGNASWAGVVVIVILGLFLAAAAIGVILRINAIDELPETQSFDEPPGSSGHHGAAGTIDLDAPK